jgi:hypothetical protein
VPLFAVLPSGLSRGSRGAGAASLVGVPGAACEVMRLPPPPPGAHPLQDDGRRLLADLDGAGVYPPVVLEGEHGDVLRLGRTRVAPRADGSLATESTADPTRDDAFEPAPRDLAATMEEQYRVVRRSLATGAPTPVEAAAPEPWSGRDGW